MLAKSSFVRGKISIVSLGSTCRTMRAMSRMWKTPEAADRGAEKRRPGAYRACFGTIGFMAPRRAIPGLFIGARGRAYPWRISVAPSGQITKSFNLWKLVVGRPDSFENPPILGPSLWFDGFCICLCFGSGNCTVRVSGHDC